MRFKITSISLTLPTVPDRRGSLLYVTPRHPKGSPRALYEVLDKTLIWEIRTQGVGQEYGEKKILKSTQIPQDGQSYRRIEMAMREISAMKICGGPHVQTVDRVMISVKEDGGEVLYRIPPSRFDNISHIKPEFSPPSDIIFKDQTGQPIEWHQFNPDGRDPGITKMEIPITEVSEVLFVTDRFQGDLQNLAEFAVTVGSPIANPDNPEENLNGFLDWVVWSAGQIAAGLAVIHEKDMMYLDLKPHNVFVDGSAETLISRMVTADLGWVTPATQEIKGEYGTPFFLPSSEWDGTPTQATDIYSFGLILSVLLFGTRIDLIEITSDGNLILKVDVAIDETHDNPKPAIKAWSDKDRERMIARLKALYPNHPKWVQLMELMANCLEPQGWQRPSANTVVDRLQNLGSSDRPEAFIRLLKAKYDTSTNVRDVFGLQSFFSPREDTPRTED